MFVIIEKGQYGQGILRGTNYYFERREDAERFIRYYKERFGEDNFFIKELNKF